MRSLFLLVNSSFFSRALNILVNNECHAIIVFFQLDEFLPFLTTIVAINSENEPKTSTTTTI